LSGGKVGRQARHDRLVDMLWANQVLQSVLAQIAQGYLRHGVVTHQLIGRLCEENLAAVSGGHQARGSIERRAEVVDLALLGWAGVQSHPCPERANLAPGLCQERTLSLHGGGEGRVGRTKGGQETVSPMVLTK
jgi:hypothetical protein